MVIVNTTLRSDLSFYSMYSAQKYSEREKVSDQECRRKESTLNLAVCGSSVPIYTQRPKTFREFKISKHFSKEPKRKDFIFPVDKIIYLTERLELTSLTEKNIKSLSLSEVNIKGNDSLRRVEKEVVWTRESSGRQEKLLNDVPPLSFDFSIDLSSIDNTGEDSDESCNKSEERFFHYSSESPVGSPSEKELCERSPVASSSGRNVFEFFGENTSLTYDECERAKNTTCDLINVYVNSLNNQELVRFLRPCGTCNQPCCICPERPSGSYTCSREHSVPHLFENAKGRSCCFRKIDRGDEIKLNDPQFFCDCLECPLLRNRFCCTEFCDREILEADSPTSFRGKENDKFGIDQVSQISSNNSVSSERMLAYTSSLANAAKSARILARDLELILNNLCGETQ